VCRAHPRSRWSAEYSGEVGTRTRRFRARFNNVVDRASTAIVARSDDVEIDSGESCVFKHQTAQFPGIDDQHCVIDPSLGAEADFVDRMACESQLHSFVLQQKDLPTNLMAGPILLSMQSSASILVSCHLLVSVK
jgi:hypothetical protein